jgi:hypothetical protein
VVGSARRDSGRAAEGTMRVARLIGLPLAGLLVGTLGPSQVLYVDAATFVIPAWPRYEITDSQRSSGCPFSLFCDQICDRSTCRILPGDTAAPHHLKGVLTIEAAYPVCHPGAGLTSAPSACRLGGPFVRRNTSRGHN